MSDFRLKVFQSVAKNLSFTKASQELFVSQPAITKHIQELETCYQTRLFDRQGSKISLTEAGELLLKHSEKILDDYKQLEYEMHLLHDEYIGELKLGASTTIAQYVRHYKINCVTHYFFSKNSSVGERPAPRGGTTCPDERKIT
ncbi:LysR family transcriptional regulator, partial [Bacteroides finegoldii]|uniref:LysR family transcriptional regulator n=1 Tax=Bacteroides finegoldii TaxID=338188 RepID=UPI001F027DE3